MIIPLNLRKSIATDQVDEIVHPLQSAGQSEIFNPPGELAAYHIQNTGIERNGGLTNIYEKETALTAGAGDYYSVAQNGAVLSSVPLNSSHLFQKVSSSTWSNFIDVDANAINYKTLFEGYHDCALSADGTVIGIQVTNQGASSANSFDLVVTELSFAGAVLNTRTTNFTNTGGIFIDVVSFVKYLNMHYADNQEIIVNQSGGHILLFKESTPAGAPTSIAITLSTVAQNYCYRFESANGYLLGEQGNGTAGQWQFLDSTFAVVHATMSITWACHATLTSGKSAVLVTNTPTINATNLDMVGYVGFDSGGTFHNTTQFLACLAGTGTFSAVTSYQLGYGYAEAFVTVTGPGQTNLYYYPSTDHTATPQTVANVTGAFINHYGRLNGSSISASSSGYDFRSVMLNNVQAAISVGAILPGSNVDEIGVLLSNVGEYDFLYAPQVQSDAAILYRYAKQFVAVQIVNVFTTAPAIPIFQKISANLYKVNTISANTIIDLARGTIEYGSTDFNGRILPTSGGASTTAVALISGLYATSIDPGQRTGNYTAGGTSISSFAYTAGHGLNGTLDSVDIYLAGIYSETLANNSTKPAYVNALKSGLLYVPSQFLPTSMGNIYGNRFLQCPNAVVLLDWYYTDPYGSMHEADIYIVGNEVFGQYTAFNLFGNTYLFDGTFIWIANIQNNLYQTKEQIAEADGLTYLSSAPNQIFFLSAFDNSLYTFTGGQTVDKYQRFNKFPTIASGAWSQRDNTLVLDCGTYFVWVRDGIVSANVKKANQSGAMSLYSTNAGIVISDNLTYTWIYSFIALSGSTVVPLTWQSAYIGPDNNQRGIISAFYLRFYNPDRTSFALTWTINTFDQDGEKQQIVSKTYSPSDWSTNGYLQVRCQPQYQSVLATSLQIAYSTKATFTDCDVEVYADQSAAISAARSS